LETPPTALQPFRTGGNRFLSQLSSLENYPLRFAAALYDGGFPLIVIIALMGKHPRFDQFFMSLGPPMLAVATILFVSHYWVA
jgi:hypothetical protein